MKAKMYLGASERFRVRLLHWGRTGVSVGFSVNGDNSDFVLFDRRPGPCRGSASGKGS